MSVFVIQIPSYPGRGVQIALRNTLDEAIALRNSLNGMGYFGIAIVEVCKGGGVVYHLPEVKRGDPLGLMKMLNEKDAPAE